jgi:NADPH-dependent ferric siderophore reductase
MTMTNDRPARPRPRLRTVEVTKVDRANPHLVRVTVSSPDLEGFGPPEAAQHVKVFFPPEGEDMPLLPVKTAEGAQFPSDVPRPVSRTYTPRRWRADTNELDIEIILHDDGLGSNWARRARPGNVLVMAGPGGRYRFNAEADWYVLAADAAGVPAMSGIIENMPSSKKIFAVAAVDGPADERTYETSATLDLRWVHTNGGSSNGSVSLEQALRGLPLPRDGRGRAWVGCESSLMRSLRSYLVNDAGMSRDALHTQGYWKVGEVNFPDHDYADDE